MVYDPLPSTEMVVPGATNPTVAVPIIVATAACRLPPTKLPAPVPLELNAHAARAAPTKDTVEVPDALRVAAPADMDDPTMLATANPAADISACARLAAVSVTAEVPLDDSTAAARAAPAAETVDVPAELKADLNRDPPTREVDPAPELDKALSANADPLKDTVAVPADVYVAAPPIVDGVPADANVLGEF